MKRGILLEFVLIFCFLLSNMKLSSEIINLDIKHENDEEKIKEILSDNHLDYVKAWSKDLNHDNVNEYITAIRIYEGELVHNIYWCLIYKKDGKFFIGYIEKEIPIASAEAPILENLFDFVDVNNDGFLEIILRADYLSELVTAIYLNKNFELNRVFVDIYQFTGAKIDRDWVVIDDLNSDKLLEIQTKQLFWEQSPEGEWCQITKIPWIDIYSWNEKEFIQSNAKFYSYYQKLKREYEREIAELEEEKNKILTLNSCNSNYAEFINYKQRKLSEIKNCIEPGIIKYKKFIKTIEGYKQKK